MNKKGLLKLILIIIALLAVGFLWFSKTYSSEKLSEPSRLFCEVDADCVPASCCHATSCVHKEYAPDCSGIFCTAVCEPGTLDCGQGSCGCVNGMCVGVFE